MDWKDFFKPTIGKLITAVIITLIEIYSLFYCYVFDAPSCGPLVYAAPILIIISLPLFFILEPIGDIVGFGLPLLLLFLIVPFSFVYIVVCALSRVKDRHQVSRKFAAIPIAIIVIIEILWAVNVYHGNQMEWTYPAVAIVSKDAMNTGTSDVNVEGAGIFTIEEKGGDVLRAGEYSIHVRKHRSSFSSENPYIKIPINGKASDVISPDTTFRLRLGSSAAATNLTTGTTLIVETDTPATTPANVLGNYDVQVIYIPDNRVIFYSIVEVK